MTATRLPGVRSSTRLRPRRTSAAALVVYVSARRLTHRACYHRRPNLPGGCCICLQQFAGDSTFITVTTSFPKKTEDWTFCPVLQLFCPMNVSLYWLLCDPTLLLRVLAVLGLYATSSLFVIIIIIIIIKGNTLKCWPKVTHLCWIKCRSHSIANCGVVRNRKRYAYAYTLVHHWRFVQKPEIS